MMQQGRTYDAFISYRHLEQDMKIAEKLQKLLEKQKIQAEGETGKKRTLRVFRDQSELPTSDNLGKDIRTALENSRYLIIICSRSYKDSKWCMEEIRYFRSLHGNTNRNILPLLIEGEPSETFPELLLWEEIELPQADGSIRTAKIETEPLAADIRADSLKEKQKKLKSKEYLRIAAPIMGVAFDDLYQRKKRAQRRTFAGVSIGITILSLAFGVYSTYLFRQISDRQSAILENESIRLANSAALQISNCDYMLALLLANEAYSFHEEANIGEINSEAATALRSAVFGKSFELDVQPLNSRAVIPFNTEGWIIEDSLADGKVLQITDGESTYLCDTANGAILYTFSGNDYVFSADMSVGVRIQRLDIYQVLFQGIRTETGDVYFDYMAECRPASYVCAFYDDTSNDCYFDIDGMINAYASSEGEIFTCSMADSDTTVLPESLMENIIGKNRFLSYQENCDFDLDRDVSYKLPECSSLELKILIIMNRLNYTEIQLTNYDHDFILASGKIDGTSDVYETLVYSVESEECIYTLDGRYLLDRNNHLLYQSQGNQLIIYQLQPDNLKQNNLGDDTVFYWVSNDGKRCCLMNNQLTGDDGESCDYAEIRVFDMDNMNQPVFCEYVEMGDTSSIKYQLNSDMSEIIYEDTAKTIHVQEIGGVPLQKVNFDDDDYIYAVALDDSGKQAAIAYCGKSAYIVVYDIETGAQTIQIDFKEYTRGSGIISHIEILGSRLLVADYENVYLFDLTQEDISEPICFSGSEQMSPFQRFLTEDDLLFCTERGCYIDGKQMYYLNKVYDIESGECIFDVSYVAYDYDPSTGFLVYQPFVEYGTAPSVFVMQREKDGSFQEVWSVKSDNVNMELLHNGMSLDGNLLLLSGKDTCEVYDLSAQYKIMETGFPGFSLKNETLYYLEQNSNGELMNWMLLEDLNSLQNKAVELLAGRVFSEEERSRYYILDRTSAQ